MRLLNQAILALAPDHRVADHAPSTFAGIVQAPGVIWSGGSERTIYGCPVVNWAFRAWHDMHHLQNGFDFTLLGERRTLEAQWAHLRLVFPSVPLSVYQLLHREIVGQAEHFDKYGTFPEDQLAFHMGE